MLILALIVCLAVGFSCYSIGRNSTRPKPKMFSLLKEYSQIRGEDLHLIMGYSGAGTIVNSDNTCFFGFLSIQELESWLENEIKLEKTIRYC